MTDLHSRLRAALTRPVDRPDLSEKANWGRSLEHARTAKLVDTLVDVCLAAKEIEAEIERGKTTDCLGCCNGNDIPDESLCRACWRIWIGKKCYFLWDWQITEKRLETLTRVEAALKEMKK